MIKKNQQLSFYSSQNFSWQSGQAMMISTILFVIVSVTIIFGLAGPILKQQKITSQSVLSRQSYFLAEAGLEDVLYRLKTGQPVGTNEVLTLNGSSVTTITTDNADGKDIVSVGEVGETIRKVAANIIMGEGVAFHYGVQVGTGGMTMGNNSVVNGSVYSNGNITGSGSITGTAASANSGALTADQTNGSGVPAYDITFGNANSTQDFAQSFQVSTTGVVNKVDLYIKKVSTPGNLTVRIVTNSGSSPSATTLTSGPLSASLVSTTYGWVSVPFSSTPELTAGTTYWLVIDSATNASRYYMVGANNNGYPGGTGKIGQYSGMWSNTSPSGLDGFFKLYLGGLTGLIDGITVGSGGIGDAYAHTVNNSTIAGNNYCQVGSGNNKACNTSLPAPVQLPMPVSDQNIVDWETEALVGGVHSGNYLVDDDTDSLGPKKITGNLTIQNNADFTVTGTLWVTGNMLVDNNATVRLASNYGTSEGVIIVDGTITISNNAVFEGSGSSGSYLMALSKSVSTNAISLANNGGSVILYAANGTINLSNNASAKSLNGKYINLNNNVNIIYDSGLVNSNFVSGPSGGWNIQSWQETE